MSVIDELQILITADSRGIESTLKKTISTVSGTVDKINSQEVDWTSIFTRSVSPAIIAGVASVFAFAISNALQFQQALNTTGTAAGQSALQLGQIGQAALGLSTQVPSSAQDIATAMTQLSAIFTNVNDQQAIAAAMAQLSAAGFGSLNDITQSSINIFKQWGVTTQQQAVSVLTSLMHGAEGAKESIPALAQQFDQFSPSLIQAGAGLSSFNGLISTFASEIKNVGLSNTTQMFQALAVSANSPVGPMELLGKATGTAGLSIDQIRKSITSGGALSALQQTSVALQKMGPEANIVATGFGFSTSQIAAFNTNAQHLPQIALDAATVAKNAQTISDAYKQSDSQLRQFMIDFNILKASLIPMADILLKGWNEFVSADWATKFVAKIQQASNTVYNSFTDAYDKIVSKYSGIANVIKPIATSVVSSFVGPIASLPSALGIGSGGIDMTKELTNALKQSGAGFSGSQISQIESKAQSSGLTEQLLRALQSSLGVQNSSYSQIKNTFNLSIPSGKSLTAQDLAHQLYIAFQGTQ